MNAANKADDGGSRELTCEILTQEGYRFLATGPPFEARHIFEPNPDDIRRFSTDFFMPGMSGLALGSWIRAAQPGVKLLSVSAHTDIVPRELHRAEAFLLKPFSRHRLAERFRCLLSLAEPQPPKNSQVSLLAA